MTKQIEELEILEIVEIETNSMLYDITVEDNHNFFANGCLVHNCELIYKKGKFMKAITRGDGRKGDDITENAKYFNGVVKELQEPWDCSVRGETMIKKSDLVSINTILLTLGKEPLKNTRNGVAGMATKFKDRNEEILSLITFYAYDIQIFAVHETGENVV